jgi:hypothetical protein
MGADNAKSIEKAILIIKGLPETDRVSKALELLQAEIDEAGGPNQEEILGVARGQVEEIRPARGQGSYVLQKIKCGDPSCHCMKKPGDSHGPYWYLFTKKNGKTRSKYIGKNLPSEASS